ncbi:DNA/RNA polymerases superfamily protein [Gossypium australe]|uniref:DNA/RNA polymerases superfamily protein n=1 Tax=Gossypium australe TaxID=47621 RepID=A0A5B6VVW9_9ROSI|nr:DNA/RNA polymerases superfamily protein [Gossypium australe]
MVSAEGIHVNPRKIEALKTVSKIRSFLGLTGYYRCFVEGFSLITAPLTKFLCKESFKKIKSALTQAPVLIQPEFDKEFVVYSDTSYVGLGYVLMQDGKVSKYCVFTFALRRLDRESPLMESWSIIRSVGVSDKR